MGKAFDKRPADWLKLSRTKKYIKAITGVRKNHSVDNLIVTERGGDNGGGITCFHEVIPLEYATEYFIKH